MSGGTLRPHPGVVIPADEVELSFSRSGGPGGQHVNTSDTSVTARLDVASSPYLTEQQRERLREKLASRMTAKGELLVTASDFRSQHRNRELALERLEELLRFGLARAKRRKPTKPSKAAKKRRLEAKKQRGRKKALRGKVDRDS
ncbi:alternative ribosome rescue aminoacyl-tRNA hydrolase ArfB [Desulfohalovibrio reitneri]|uniref:alternative ribosome rescue aminoacyl-tRNA hydrolase ArfB n=1 Tax=Desulfohalovibrio reitneri TaxID=1307759 RepID=UPI0004A766DF|nr:alternative ribosome rescue aminoacyl-tRNA hydrolase ArfB [Desulfohalovibrio reitneri]